MLVLYPPSPKSAGIQYNAWRSYEVIEAIGNLILNNAGVIIGVAIVIGLAIGLFNFFKGLF